MPPFLKGTKKGETTCNLNFFAHFQSQNYFYLHSTCVLTPWLDAGALIFVWDISPWEVVETPPPPQERGEVFPPPLGTIRWPPLPHHCKSKKPSVNTWLTLNTFEIQMQSTYHTFLVTNLLICIGFPVLQ